MKLKYRYMARGAALAAIAISLEMPTWMQAVFIICASIGWHDNPEPH